MLLRRCSRGGSRFEVACEVARFGGTCTGGVTQAGLPLIVHPQRQLLYCRFDTRAIQVRSASVSYEIQRNKLSKEGVRLLGGTYRFFHEAPQEASSQFLTGAGASLHHRSADWEGGWTAKLQQDVLLARSLRYR